MNLRDFHAHKLEEAQRKLVELNSKEQFSFLLNKLSKLSFSTDDTRETTQTTAEHADLLHAYRQLLFVRQSRGLLQKYKQTLEKERHLNLLATNCLGELQKLNWPTQPVTRDSHMDPFTRLFLQLGDHDDFTFAFSVLTRPLVTRFKFHFYGKQPTNRLDKPEWFFCHITNLVKTHRYLLSVIQPRLPETVNAVDEFLFSFFDVLAQKVNSAVGLLDIAKYEEVDEDEKDLDAIETENRAKLSLLSHLFRECLNFDKTIFQLYNFSYHKKLTQPQIADGYFTDLVASNYQKLFVEAESHVLLSKLEKILDDPNRFNILSKGITQCALATLDLVEGLTELYKRFSLLKTRLRFLQIQFRAFEVFRDRLSLILKDNLKPIRQVQDLTIVLRCLTTTKYVTTVLDRCSSSPFFVQMLEVIPDAVGVFDGVIEEYKLFMTEIIVQIVKVTSLLLDPELSAYKARPRFSNIGIDVVSESPDISSQFIPVLNKMHAIMELCQDELVVSLFELVYSSITKATAKSVLNVITSRMYSTVDAKAIKKDIMDGYIPLLKRFDTFGLDYPLNTSQIVEAIRILNDSFDNDKVEKALETEDAAYFEKLGFEHDLDTIRSIYQLRLTPQ